MRRLAWLNLERRSRSASISTLSSPLGFTFPPLAGLRSSRIDSMPPPDSGRAPVQPVPILPFWVINHNSVTIKGLNVTSQSHGFW